jgi:hypothetical protein
MAIAVKVNGYESVNVIPHITVAINPDGGKPVMSNNITNWVNVKPFDVEVLLLRLLKKNHNICCGFSSYIIFN